MDLDDTGIQTRFVLHDRDASFSAKFELPVRRDQTNLKKLPTKDR